MKDNQQSEPQLKVRTGHSNLKDPRAAVREIASCLRCDDARLTILYFNAEYDREQLAASIKETFSGVVIGCTSAGQLTGQGFVREGMSGCVLCGSGLTAFSYLIHPLAGQLAQIEKIAADIEEKTASSRKNGFGLLLIDGLSGQEEALSNNLYRALGDVAIIGGSAGDSLKFENTWVYHEGRMLQDAALFTFCLCDLPFYAFKHQHLHATAKRLVVTGADPAQRLVKEINGYPAAEEYARIIGVPAARLNFSIFSKYPLVVQIGDDIYVRSIAEIAENHFLRLYCAIEVGLVLRVGEGNSMIESFAEQLKTIRAKLGDYAVILGCDCILRRLEAEEKGEAGKLGKFMGDNGIFGFSTYGEQFNSLHINQTFTGIALGRRLVTDDSNNT